MADVLSHAVKVGACSSYDRSGVISGLEKSAGELQANASRGGRNQCPRLHTCRLVLVYGIAR